MANRHVTMTPNFIIRDLIIEVLRVDKNTDKLIIAAKNPVQKARKTLPAFKQIMKDTNMQAKVNMNFLLCCDDL